LNVTALRGCTYTTGVVKHYHRLPAAVAYPTYPLPVRDLLPTTVPLPRLRLLRTRIPAHAHLHLPYCPKLLDIYTHHTRATGLALGSAPHTLWTDAPPPDGWVYHTRLVDLYRSTFPSPTPLDPTMRDPGHYLPRFPPSATFLTVAGLIDVMTPPVVAWWQYLSPLLVAFVYFPPRCAYHDT